MPPEKDRQILIQARRLWQISGVRDLGVLKILLIKLEWCEIYQKAETETCESARKRRACGCIQEMAATFGKLSNSVH